jgi:hypothetical protein
MLALSKNQLTGSIPPELGNLTNLFYLVLNNNQLSGPIPPELGNLAGLELLILSDNQLSGSIPPEVGNMTSLGWLYLHNNRLSGEFPTSITNLTGLATLTFDCWMTSTIPSVIAFIDTISPGWQNGICPVVLSITRGSSNPIGSSTVDFIVTFSEPVTGVNTSDFTLKTSGIFSSAVSGVSGSGNNYTVTVNTGAGNSGTIRLDLPVHVTINDLDGNPLSRLPFTSGDSYTVNKLIPKAPILRSPRTNTVTHDTTPTFWWTRVTGGLTYEIEFALDNTFTNHIDSKLIDGSSYSASSPFAAGNYFWHVRAYSSSNQPGVWSSTRAFTIDTTGPSTPTVSSPANNSTSNHTPTFKWLKVPTAVSYEFQYDDSQDMLSPLYTLTLRSTFRRPPAMKAGTYYWHVRAKDAVGNWSVWSTPFKITITSP